jgi:hypothetical protein
MAIVTAPAFAETGESPVSLRALARQCRCLAQGASNAQVATSLREMADGYERQADKAEAEAALIEDD